MGVQGAVPDVERLVVDQQPDHLAVGDVDDGLPAVGVPVAGLGVGQRPDLVHGVEVGAGQPVRVSLVQVAAQPDVPVGQREDRLALGQQVQVQFLLDQPPGLGSVRGLLDHLFPSRSSDRSLTTMSAPCALSSAAWPTRSTPTTRAQWPAWPAATPPGASSKPTACAAGTPSASAAARNVSGAGLPRRPRSWATTPSILASNRSSIPAACRTWTVLALAETIAVRMPPARTALM